MSVVDTILAAPDLAEHITYLAQQSPGGGAGGGGGGGGGGEEGLITVMEQIGAFIRRAGLVILSIVCVLIAIKVIGSGVSSKENSGLRNAVSSVGVVLFGCLLFGVAATVAGYVMEFGSVLG